MGKNIIVLGNGFDIAFGFKTRFADFVNCAYNKYWPFKNPPVGDYSSISLHNHFYQYYQQNKDAFGNIRWIDVEGELYDFAKSKVEGSFTADSANEDRLQYENLKKCLFDYIDNEICTPHKYDLDFKINKNVEILWNAIKLNGGYKSIYTFNYTNPQNILQAFVDYNLEELPKVHYVHGSIENKNIILGINEDLSLPVEYSFLYKCNDLIPNNLIADLEEADDVIFYGLSFGQIDMSYFESYFNRIATLKPTLKKKKITIITSDKESAEYIRTSIRKIKVTISSLQRSSDFMIIPIMDVNFDDSIKQLFNTFIQSLNDENKFKIETAEIKSSFYY